MNKNFILAAKIAGFGVAGLALGTLASAINISMMPDLPRYATPEAIAAVRPYMTTGAIVGQSVALTAAATHLFGRWPARQAWLLGFAAIPTAAFAMWGLSSTPLTEIAYNVMKIINWGMLFGGSIGMVATSLSGPRR